MGIGDWAQSPIPNPHIYKSIEKCQIRNAICNMILPKKMSKINLYT